MHMSTVSEFRLLSIREGSRLRMICSITVLVAIGFAAAYPAAGQVPRSLLLLDQGYIGSPGYDAYAYTMSTRGPGADMRRRQFLGVVGDCNAV